MYRKRKATYQENKGKIYLVVIGQCTDAMIAKLKGDSNFDLIKHNSTMLGLIGMIKKVSFKVETQQYILQSFHIALRRFYTHVHFQPRRSGINQYCRK